MNVDRFVKAVVPKLAEYESPEFSEQMCGLVSSWVRFAAELAGLDSWMAACEMVEGGAGHHFVVIDNHVVDFTLSQFDDTAPFPFVSPLRSAEVRRLYKRIENCEKDYDWQADVVEMDDFTGDVGGGNLSELSKALKKLGVSRVKVTKALEKLLQKYRR